MAYSPAPSQWPAARRHSMAQNWHELPYPSHGTTVATNGRAGYSGSPLAMPCSIANIAAPARVRRPILG